MKRSNAVNKNEGLDEIYGMNENFATIVGTRNGQLGNFELRQLIMLKSRNAFGLSVLALSLLLTSGSLAEPVEFVVLGDMPYGEDQVDSLNYIGNKIRKAVFPFVIHYGDLKSGGTSCDL